MTPIPAVPVQLDGVAQPSSDDHRSTRSYWDRLKLNLRLYGTVGLTPLTFLRFNTTRGRCNVTSSQSRPRLYLDIILLGTNSNKTSLLSLPVEIIQVIADYLRYFPQQRPSKPGPALRPSLVTLDVSRFSRVCKYLRWIAEPTLYRDLHLDFTGLSGSGMPPFVRPLCRLDLLLRTLADRCELRDYVKLVVTGWPDHTMEFSSLATIDSKLVARNFLQFFGYCKRVETLIGAFPVELFSSGPSLSEVKTVVTGSSSNALRALASTFPRLEAVYLEMDYGDALPDSDFQHQIKTLRLYTAPSVYLMHTFTQVLEVCGNVTEELHIYAEGSAFRDALSPIPFTLSPLAGVNLQYLRLHGEGFNILGHPNSIMGSMVRNLRSLRHLHVAQPRTIDPAAITNLPPSLRSLHLSNYGSWYGPVESRHLFALDLSKCLQRSEVAAMVKSVATHGLTQASVMAHALGDLGPLGEVCKEQGIPFSLDVDEFSQYYLELGQLNEVTPEIRILCKSFSRRDFRI
jgi:hypothetical protein